MQASPPAGTHRPSVFASLLRKLLDPVTRPPLRSFPNTPGSLSPSCWAFGLGFEAQTEKPSSDGFVAQPSNPAYKLRLLAATLHRLSPRRCLALLAPCRPHSIPSGHRVPRTKPTCLSTPRRPLWLRPFALVLHLHQRKPSRIVHLHQRKPSRIVHLQY